MHLRCWLLQGEQHIMQIYWLWIYSKFYFSWNTGRLLWTNRIEKSCQIKKFAVDLSSIPSVNPYLEKAQMHKSCNHYLLQHRKNIFSILKKFSTSVKIINNFQHSNKYEPFCNIDASEVEHNIRRGSLQSNVQTLQWSEDIIRARNAESFTLFNVGNCCETRKFQKWF